MLTKITVHVLEVQTRNVDIVETALLAEQILLLFSNQKYSTE
jgi:hypothetical protein